MDIWIWIVIAVVAIAVVAALVYGATRGRERRHEAKREYGYYVLPLLVGADVVGRAEPRFDPKTGTLDVLGAWGDTSRLDEALNELAAWLGAERADRSFATWRDG